MKNFTYEEINLMALYNTGNRERLIEVLTEMRSYLTWSEAELRDLTDSTLDKLADMTDAEFDALELYRILSERENLWQTKKTTNGSAISSPTWPPGPVRQEASPTHSLSFTTATNRLQPASRSCVRNPTTAKNCRVPG